MILSPRTFPVRPGPKHPVPSVVTVALRSSEISQVHTTATRSSVSTSSFPLSSQAPDRSRWMTVSVTRAQRVPLQGCTNDATTLPVCTEAAKVHATENFSEHPTGIPRGFFTENISSSKASRAKGTHLSFEDVRKLCRDYAHLHSQQPEYNSASSPPPAT